MSSEVNFTAGEAAVKRLAGVTAGVDVVAGVVGVVIEAVAATVSVADGDTVVTVVVEGPGEGVVLVTAGLHPVIVSRIQRRMAINEGKYFTLTPAKEHGE